MYGVLDSFTDYPFGLPGFFFCLFVCKPSNLKKKIFKSLD